MNLRLRCSQRTSSCVKLPAAVVQYADIWVKDFRRNRCTSQNFEVEVLQLLELLFGSKIDREPITFRNGKERSCCLKRCEENIIMN